MNEIADLLMNSGVTIVMLAYFIYRDFKFMQKLDATLDVITSMVQRDIRKHDLEEVQNGSSKE